MWSRVRAEKLAADQRSSIPKQNRLNSDVNGIFKKSCINVAANLSYTVHEGCPFVFKIRLRNQIFIIVGRTLFSMGEICEIWRASY